MDVVFRANEATMFCILVFLLSFESSSLAYRPWHRRRPSPSSVEFSSRLPLPNRAIGPEAFVFKSSITFLTGVADGRILEYQGLDLGFFDYAYTAPNRSRAVCDGYNGNTDPVLGPKCGRPLGIGYYRKTGELYVADAYLGLLVVRQKEKFARPIANSAGGVPFRLPDGLDVDESHGIVYFTDASSKFGLTEFARAIAVNDSTGRLLKYDLQTKTITVLLSGLSGPTGVAVSNDGVFLLVTEFIGRRIQKYWLKGPKANTAEILLKLRGQPNNIKSTASPSEFWVASYEQAHHKVLNSLSAYKILGDNGTILVKSYLTREYNNSEQVSEVNQVRRTLRTGSMTAPYIIRYKIKP